MTPTTPHPTTAPRRRLLPFWVLGLSLLVFSVLCAVVLLHGVGTPRALAQNSTSSTPADEMVVSCIGRVDVEAGVQFLTTAQSGRVRKIVSEGEHEYAPGDPLLEIDDELEKHKVEEAEADVRAAQTALSQAEDMQKDYQAGKGQQDFAIQAVEHELEATRQQSVRAQELVQKEQLNASEGKAAQEKVKVVEAKLEAEKAKLRETKKLIDVTVLRAREDLKAKQARLEEARYGVKECKLVAPTKGTVLRTLCGVGDLTGPQAKQAALIFCPSTPRLVRAEVEQEFAGRVSKGMVATIRDDATDQGRWTGKVVRVADWFYQRTIVLPEPVPLHDVQTVQCIIELDPSPTPLRINQRVRVELHR